MDHGALGLEPSYCRGLRTCSLIHAGISQLPVRLKLTHYFLCSSSYQGRAQRVGKRQVEGKKVEVEGSKWPGGGYVT